MKPGIYEDLSMEDYHADEAISKSTLVDFYNAPSPWHYLSRKPNEGAQFDMGSMVHAAILEHDKYQDMIAVPPPEVLAKNGARSGNAWYLWKEDQEKAGRTILTRDQKRDLDYAIEQLFSPQNTESAELLTGGLSECSFFFKSPITGHMAKCRPDHLPGNEIIVDLKTTSLPAMSKDFERQFVKLKYIWSVIWTCRGISAVTGVAHDDYRFVVVELNEPYGVVVYKVDQRDISLESVRLDMVERRLVECIKSNNWPGYPEGIQTILLPSWERVQIEKEIGGSYE